MKAYKGFDKDLKCRGFQYKIGNEHKETKSRLCCKRNSDMRKRVIKWIKENEEGVFGAVIIVGLFISAYTIAIILTLWLC